MSDVITGVIGFAGVIITLLYNASAARKLEKEKFDRERAGVASALRAELRVLRTSIQYHYQTVALSAEPKTLRMPTGFYSASGKIFDNLADRLVFLRGETVEAVCECHMRVRRIIDDAVLFKALSLDDGDVTEMPGHEADKVSRLLEGVLTSVDEAIAELSKEVPRVRRTAG